MKTTPTRFHVLLLAAATLLLGACSEKPQAGASNAGLDKPPYAGTGSNFTVPGWTAGDRTSWESQLKARTQRGQNEYNKTVVAR